MAQGWRRGRERRTGTFALVMNLIPPRDLNVQELDRGSLLCTNRIPFAIACTAVEAVVEGVSMCPKAGAPASRISLHWREERRNTASLGTLLVEAWFGFYQRKFNSQILRQQSLCSTAGLIITRDHQMALVVCSTSRSLQKCGLLL